MLRGRARSWSGGREKAGEGGDCRVHERRYFCSRPKRESKRGEDAKK